MINDEKLLRVFRAKLAATKTLHKTAARQCHISNSMFSQYINGDLPMPEKVKNRLITLLGLKSFIERLEGVSSERK